MGLEMMLIHVQQLVAREQILQLLARHEGLVADGMHYKVDAHRNEVGKYNFVVAGQVLIDVELGYGKIHFDNGGMHALLQTVAGIHYLLYFQNLHSMLVHCLNSIELYELFGCCFGVEYKPLPESEATEQVLHCLMFHLHPGSQNTWVVEQNSRLVEPLAEALC